VSVHLGYCGGPRSGLVGRSIYGNRDIILDYIRKAQKTRAPVHQRTVHRSHFFNFLVPLNSSSHPHLMTSDVCPGQLALEFRTGIIHDRAGRATCAALLWCLTAVIARRGAICWHILVNRGSRYIIARWEAQPKIIRGGGARKQTPSLTSMKEKNLWAAKTHCRFWFDRAAARTSDRKRFTSSTMSFFIPSIESSSSKKKSNFCPRKMVHS
jgi:hypothetical protein